MKRKAFLALAMSVGLAMNAGQAGAVVADPGVAVKAASGKQTAPIAKVWWRGHGPGWHGGWRHGYGRPGYGWVPFAALGAALAATGAYYYSTAPYYYEPYYYGPHPYYGPCGAAPCEPPPPPLK